MAAAILLTAAVMAGCTGNVAGTGSPESQLADGSPVAAVTTPSAPPVVVTPTELAIAPTAIPGVPYAPPPDFPSVDPASVQTTDSGLKYADLEVGTGPTPTEGQTITAHYTGWLVNGYRFDSSVERDLPMRFQLGAGQVMKGWEEGFATMKVGGRRLLVIPPDLAYGSQGNGPIPPNAIVIFEVQLVSAE
jgi:peptidylprolyl isomerase